MLPLQKRLSSTLELTSLTSVWDMVPDVGTPSSMTSAPVRAFDLAPAETAPRRALERSLEFFSRKVNIWKNQSNFRK